MNTSLDGIYNDNTSPLGTPVNAPSQTQTIGNSPQPSESSLSAPVFTESLQPINVATAPSDTPPVFETPVTPVKTPRHLSPRLVKRGLISLGILLLACGGIFFLQHKQNTLKSQSISGAKASSQFSTINIPLSQFENSGQLSIGGDHTLSINGQLRANNTVIVTPTTQPAAPLTGQIYFDQTANQLEYYDGTKFVSLVGGVQNVGGSTGSLTLGGGLRANGQQISNSGVLSIQGQTGNINFTSGPGIAVNGTTLSNSGLISLGGQNGTIALGNGLQINGHTLSNSGVIGVSSATPSLIVSNDGNGNITLTNNGGGGTVSSIGGTNGKLAVFTGTQIIADSLVSQSGGLVTVTGNLSVTGTTTLSTPLSVGNGGTAANNAASARSNLSAAESGANSDITSLSGLTTALSVLQGGTGLTTVANNGVVIGQGTSALTTIAT